VLARLLFDAPQHHLHSVMLNVAFNRSCNAVRKTSLMSRLTVSCTLLLFLAAPSLCVAADTTNNVAISATVLTSCRVNSGALNFNTYDPVSLHASTPLQRSGIFRVTCTNGSSALAKLSQGNNPASGSSDASPIRRMEGDPGIYLSYELYQDASYSTAWGNTNASGKSLTGSGTQNNIPVYGRIAQGQPIPQGTYSDTIFITVSF
jgi:spore coat protein U-like protein